MRAAYILEPGPARSIRCGDLPKPVPDGSQVLVKVAAVAVNPIDTYIRGGAYPMALQSPFIIGRDMAGTVEAVGPVVGRFAPGDRVWCNNQGYHGRQGTFAEFVAVDEAWLYSLPTGVGEREAVAVAHSALTACLGLVREAELRAGETVFVNGGSGNVGSAVLQLARNMGARVIVTAGGERKLRRCLELGAERAIDYQTEDVTAAVRDFAPRGVDVHWDTTRRPDFERAVPLLAHRGRIILMAGLDAHPSFPVGAFYTRDCSMHGFAVTNASEEELRGSAEIINRWLAASRLRAVIDRVLPLAEAAAALELVEARLQGRTELGGKIVLEP